MDNSNLELIGEYQALIGEYAWHSLTVDPTLKSVSDDHYDYVVNVLRHYGRLDRCGTMRVLEVASYAHTTGYRLQQELHCAVTLFEISARALELGQRMAGANGLATQPRLVAGDFHVLPFESNSFDLVYIASAIHHTWKYETVVSELQRVLAPGGLLLLLNEPCHRQCCFYRFRTNRPTNFTKFERTLNDLGIIRTFAEPYLGSRPETLFGMIENQMIPLERLLNLLGSDTKIMSLVLSPEVCMGELEDSWLVKRDLGFESLCSIIESDLTERRAEAMKHFDDVAAGMQFYLPSADELQPFAKQIAEALCRLPPASDEKAYRQALSEIFGAPVQIIAEKPGDSSARAEHTLKNGFEEKDGITYTFDDRIKRILLHNRSLLPDIQVADKNEINKFFPESDWQYCVTEEGSIATLALRSQSGCFNIPADQNALLFVLRYSCMVPEQTHVNVRIQHLDRPLYLQEVWQSESLLCVALLPPAKDGTRLELFRDIILPNGECETSPGGLGIAFAAAFRLTDIFDHPNPGI